MPMLGNVLLRTQLRGLEYRAVASSPGATLARSRLGPDLWRCFGSSAAVALRPAAKRCAWTISAEHRRAPLQPRQGDVALSIQRKLLRRHAAPDMAYWNVPCSSVGIWYVSFAVNRFC